jgi:hypothetical protein
MRGQSSGSRQNCALAGGAKRRLPRLLSRTRLSCVFRAMRRVGSNYSLTALSSQEAYVALLPAEGRAPSAGGGLRFRGEFPPFENREGWGSLSRGDSDGGKSGPAPMVALKFLPEDMAQDPAANCSRIARFWIFPTEFLGSTGWKTTRCGALNLVTCCAKWRRMSSSPASLPGFS